MVIVPPAPWDITTENRDKGIGRRDACKYCGSTRLVKNGHYKGKQVLLCRTCGHGFYANGLFPKRRTPPDVIAFALDEYFNGLSLKKVCRAIQKRFGFRFSRYAVWDWAVKYSDLVDSMIRQLRPGLAGIWEADETAVFVRGRQTWVWNALDANTRFLIASWMSKGREFADARSFLMETTRRADRPKVIVTDGLQTYHDAIWKIYGSLKKARRVQHVRSPGLKTGNKNRIERFHGTFKERYKVMRGLKNPETGFALVKGFNLQYNFLRPHEALDGRTPAESAGIALPFEDGWANLIDWATIYRSRKNLISDGTSDVLPETG